MQIPVYAVEGSCYLLAMRKLIILCLIALSHGAISQTAQPSQAEQPGVFRESSTGMVVRYPVELVLHDAQKSMDEGHIAIYGSLKVEGKEHELAKRCFKPMLLADLPSEANHEKDSAKPSPTTFLMFEFMTSKECKAGYKYKDDERVTGGVAQTAIQFPGATPLSPPLWLDCGKQKLHISFAALGLQSNSKDDPHLLLTTAAMLYHGHVFGWVISSDQLSTFNDLTKSSIELDDGKAYEIVPFNLDDHLKLPVNPVK